MKRIPALFAAAALAALASPANAATPLTGPESCIGGPVNPEAFALALGIVETIIPPDQGEAMMKQIMLAISGQLDQSWGPATSDAGLQAIYDRKMAEMPDRLMPVVKKHLPRIVSAMSCAYVREFSVDELREIAAFAKTPAGKRYLARSTALIGDPSVAAANQAYFADVRPVAEAFGAEVAQEVSEYRAKKNKR